LGYKEGDFSITEKAAPECLSPPIHPELTGEQIGRVAAVKRELFVR
jgi:dTDP-4-amino-4,6-dideoxygalactose transaminase